MMMYDEVDEYDFDSRAWRCGQKLKQKWAVRLVLQRQPPTTNGVRDICTACLN
jgi:hypothetical protein